MSVYKYDPDEDDHFIGEDDDFTTVNEDFEVAVKSVFLALNDCYDIGRFVWRVKFNVVKKTLTMIVAEDRHGQVATMLSRLGNAEDDLHIEIKGLSDLYTEGHTKVFGDLFLKRHNRATRMQRDYGTDRVIVTHRLKFTYGTFEVRLPKTKPIKLHKSGR